MASRHWHLPVLVVLIVAPSRDSGRRAGAAAAHPVLVRRAGSGRRPGPARTRLRHRRPAGRPRECPCRQCRCRLALPARSATAYTLLPSGGVHYPTVLLLEADEGVPGSSPIQLLLQAYGDLGAVDVFDARFTTPTLAQLMGYEVVLVWANYSFADPTAVGDALADSVDAGGKVIDFQFAIMGMLQGRFQNEGYSAMTSTYTLYALSCLGDYDAGSLLMRGIAPGNVCDMFRGPDTALTAGSRAAARWQDGELFVAYKTNRSVVAINAYVGASYLWTGQMADVVHNAMLWLTTPPVLHIATINTTLSVRLALEQLGTSYDLYQDTTGDWTGLDLDFYDTVIVGMDGGYIGTASIQKVRSEVIDAGKRLVFLGGTCWEEFANAVNTYLVGNDTANYCWAISGPPQWTVTNKDNLLAYGFPSPYNYASNEAGYYQLRANDPAIEQVAVNGDGYPALFRKPFPGNPSGDLVWYIDSVAGDYWTDPSDFAFLKQLVKNALGRYHVYVPFVVRQH